MKRLLAKPVLSCALGGCGLLAVHTTGLGQSVNLAWDRSDSPQTTGYKIYYWQEGGSFTKFKRVGRVTSVTISELIPGMTYHFAATALDDAGDESVFSNEITAVAPVPVVTASGANESPALTPVLSANGQFEFTLADHDGGNYVVQASTDLIHWEPVQTNVAPFTFVDDTTGYSQRFFRTVLMPP